MWVRLLALLCLLVAMDAGSTPAANVPAPAGPSLQAEQVAVVVNDEDANSVAVANYYRQARHIPEKTVVHVRIPGSPRKLSVAEFNALKQQIEANIGPEIQAVIIVLLDSWGKRTRVGDANRNKRWMESANTPSRAARRG